MKNLRLLVVSTFILGSMFFAQNLRAQNSPCGWTILSQVCQPTCYGLCDGSIVVTPSISLPNVTYLWNNGSTSSSLSGLCAEDYIVTVTDANNCSQTITLTVADPALLVASCVTTANESAPGAADGSIEASVSGGYGPYEFEWQTTPLQYGSVITGLTAGVYTVIVYDEKKCLATTSCEIITEEELNCDGFRTQTQGGWGQCHQNGNNPGTYLFANFDAAFPGDLTIGCTNTLKLTSAQAVCDFLPSGTTPRVLPAGALVDPSQTYRNVFAGQLVAATLNVGFDLTDPSFGAAGVNLGDMIIGSGTFMGWTVNQLLVAANEKIGGCASPYSASQLSAALDAINNNYVDGTRDNGFLVCPNNGNRVSLINADQLNVSMYPNPVSGNASIKVIAANDDVLQIDVYNVSGQKTNSLFKGEVKSQEVINLNLDATLLTPGIYFMKIISSEKVHTQKFIVKD